MSDNDPICATCLSSLEGLIGRMADEGVLERRLGVSRAIVARQDMRGNHRPSRSLTAMADGTGSDDAEASILGARHRGTKNAFPTSVGTTALTITAAIEGEWGARG